MSWLRSTFAGRLIAAVFLLVLLPTVLLGAFVYSPSREQAMATETARIADASAELANLIDAFIIDERDLARYASATREVREFMETPDEAAAMASLQSWLWKGPFVSGHDHVADIYLLDEQGICVASTNPSIMDQSYSVRPYYQKAMGGSDYISDWSIGITSGTPGIYLSSPIRGAYNEVNGVLVVKLQTAPIDTIVEQAFEVGTRAALLNEAGIVLGAYEPGLRYRAVDELTSEEQAQIASTQQFAGEELAPLGLTTLREDLDAIPAGATVLSREYSLDGDARVAALSRLQARPWTLAVVAPLADIEAAAASVPLIIGVIIVLVLVYATFATLYLTRFVVRPIRDLVSSSHGLAAGRLTAQVPVRGDDEVAQLATAFNSMATEIRGDTERLEGEVARRTAELEEANRAITQLSITDPLTGCYNRLYLDQQLAREIERAARYDRDLSVIMCDLDLFKEVNDVLGHAAGDAVLRRLGGHLNTMRRDSDWVARFGGEEFVLVLPETSVDRALALAERLRSSLAGLVIDHDGGSITVTGSFGVTALAPGDSPEALLARSDVALYRAKADGRNRVFAEPASP